MSPRSGGALLLAGAAVCGLGACALFSKSAPIAPRYFSPERPGEHGGAPASSAQATADLRLGRIDSAANIGEMIIFRDSVREVGYYRLRRWTEAPERYLRRRLARVLFEEHGLRQVMGGSGPTLDLELTAFEEVRSAPAMARVQVIVRFHDQRRVRWEETITVEEPVVQASDADSADAAVAAIGAALRTAVERIADGVLLELAPERTRQARW